MRCVVLALLCACSVPRTFTLAATADDRPPRQIGACWVTLVRWEPPDVRWQVGAITVRWEWSEDRLLTASEVFQLEQQAMRDRKDCGNCLCTVRGGCEGR